MPKLALALPLAPTRERRTFLMQASVNCALIVLVFLVGFLLSAEIAQGQAGEGSRVLQLQDVFHLQHAADVQISPDERYLVYLRLSEDIMTDQETSRLWEVDLASGEEKPLTTEAVSSPRWSPDGKRLAFVANDTAGHAEIYVRTLQTGASVCISALKQNPSDIAWSPDGRSLSFLMFVPEPREILGTLLPKPAGAHWADPPIVTTALHYQADGAGALTPGHAHLFVLPSEGGLARQLSESDYDRIGSPSWTPDGQHLLFNAIRRGPQEDVSPDTNIFDLRIEDGTVVQLTHRRGPDQQAAASPDGRLIAYTGYDERGRDYDETKLYLMNRDGTHARLLSANLDRDVFGLAWSRDGQALYVLYEDHGQSKVALLQLSGKITMLAAGIDGGFSLGNQGSLAFAWTRADSPPEVAVKTVGKETHQVTHMNADLLKGTEIGKLKALPVTSSYDRARIEAWILLPPGYDPGRRYPTILAIHGGPYGDFNPAWSTRFQLYAAAGYVVLFANERGSIGYGDAFSQGIYHDFPGHDYEDQLSVVDAAIAAGVSDPQRLFVNGGSAGGEMTTWIIGKTDRFSAAVAEKPVINDLSESLETDQYAAANEMFGTFPWEDAKVFWKHSPLSLVGNVKTPTLIMVGDEDRRTPITESEQYYDALKLRGVPTVLVRVPGASHEGLTSRPSQFAAEISLTLAWFNRYLSRSALQSNASSRLARPR